MRGRRLLACGAVAVAAVSWLAVLASRAGGADAPPGGGAPPAPGAAAEAALVASEETFSFGDVDQGQVVEHTILLRNRGASPFEITRLSTSCGCSAALLAATRFAPGEERPLRLTYNSAGRRGRQGGTVTIESTDRARPVYLVTFQLNVIAPPQPVLHLAPYQLDFGLVPPDAGAAAAPPGVVEIRNDGERDLVLRELHPSEGLTLEAAPPLPATVPPGGRLELRLRLRPTAGRGLVKETVLIISNDAAAPSVGLGAIGYVAEGGRPHLEVGPSFWDFGVIRAGATAQATIGLSNSGSANLVIKTIRLGDPVGATVAVPFTIPPGGRTDLVLHLVNTAAHPGQTIDTWVWIDSEEPRAPTRGIEVSGFIDRPVAPAPGGARRVSLVVAADRRGAIEPCECAEGRLGGLARAVTLLDLYRGRGLAPLALEAGDLFGPAGEPYFDLRAEVAIDALNTGGYGAATLGEAELRFGPRRLHELVARAHFPIVSANVLDAATGKPFPGARFTQVERPGVRIAVTGVLAPDFPFAPPAWSRPSA